jgi:hypothetical protein
MNERIGTRGHNFQGNLHRNGNHPRQEKGRPRKISSYLYKTLRRVVPTYGFEREVVAPQSCSHALASQMRPNVTMFNNSETKL